MESRSHSRVGAAARMPQEMPGPEASRRMEIPVLTGTGAIRARQVRDALNTGNFDAVTYAAGRGKRGKFSDILSEESQAYFRRIWSSATAEQRAEFMRQMSIFFDDEHAGAGGAGLKKMAAIIDKMRNHGVTLAEFSDYSKKAGVRVSGARRRATRESIPTPVEEAPAGAAPYEITEAERASSRRAVHEMDRRMQEYFAENAARAEAAPAAPAPSAPTAAPSVTAVDWADERVSGVPEGRRVPYEEFIKNAAAAGMRITDPMALIAQLERVASGRAAVVNMPANQNADARRRDVQKLNGMLASVGLSLRVRETWAGDRYVLSIIGARPIAGEAPAQAAEAPVAAESRVAYSYEDFRLRMDRINLLVPQGYDLRDPAIFHIPESGGEVLAIYKEVRDHFADLDAILADASLDPGRRRALTNLRDWVNDALTLAGV